MRSRGRGARSDGPRSKAGATAHDSLPQLRSSAQAAPQVSNIGARRGGQARAGGELKPKRHATPRPPPPDRSVGNVTTCQSRRCRVTVTRRRPRVGLPPRVRRLDRRVTAAALSSPETTNEVCRARARAGNVKVTRWGGGFGESSTAAAGGRPRRALHVQEERADVTVRTEPEQQDVEVGYRFTGHGGTSQLTGIRAGAVPGCRGEIGPATACTCSASRAARRAARPGSGCRCDRGHRGGGPLVAPPEVHPPPVDEVATMRPLPRRGPPSPCCLR